MAGKYLVITDKLELELKKMRSEGITKLPSEAELSKKFSCSRQTVRASLDILRHKGLIEKRKGSGSYIAGGLIKNRDIFFMTEDCDRYQNPFLINGLKEKLASYKYRLKAFSTGGSIKGEKDILTRVIEDRPSVLITEPSADLIPDPNMRLIEEIEDLGIPVIFCNSSLGTVHAGPDHLSAGRMLMNKLTGKGRKKTACIFRTDRSSGHDFYRGYIDAVLDSGYEFDESGCLMITHKEENDIISGKDGILSTFADEIAGSFDSVICHNKVIACRLMQMLKRKGMSVPEDLDIACFDNTALTPDTEGMMILEYDMDAFCRSLGMMAAALAEGREAKSFTVPFKPF